MHSSNPLKGSFFLPQSPWCLLLVVYLGGILYHDTFHLEQVKTALFIYRNPKFSYEKLPRASTKETVARKKVWRTSPPKPVSTDGRPLWVWISSISNLLKCRFFSYHSCLGACSWWFPLGARTMMTVVRKNSPLRFNCPPQTGINTWTSTLSLDLSKVSSR